MSALLRKLQQQKADEKPVEKKAHVHRPMIVGNKGMIHATAEILDDVRKCIPHAKKDVKITQEDFKEMKEIASDMHCDTVALFETKHHLEPYLWLADAANGPTICFFMEEGKSIYDLGLVGNPMKGSRPLLFFDPAFDKTNVLKLSRNLLQRLFEVPFNDKHSKPFVDRTMSFFTEDNKIIIRHYQIQWDTDPTRLVEVGPRITLVPIFILADVFRGHKIWKNATWESPTAQRRDERKQSALAKQRNRDRDYENEVRLGKIEKPVDPHAGLFAPVE